MYADFFNLWCSIIYNHCKQQEATTEPRFYYWLCWKNRAQQQADQKQRLIVIHILLFTLLCVVLPIHLPPYIRKKKKKKSKMTLLCFIPPYSHFVETNYHGSSKHILSSFHSSPDIRISLTTLVVLMLFLTHIYPETNTHSPYILYLLLLHQYIKKSPAQSMPIVMFFVIIGL